MSVQNQDKLNRLCKQCLTAIIQNTRAENGVD